MHYAKTASKLREQIVQFSGELSFNWGKVVRRFVTEAIYGIQARQSVRLTEIARALGEEIPVKKIQYRLCRQLGREGLGARLMAFSPTSPCARTENGRFPGRKAKSRISLS